MEKKKEYEKLKRKLDYLQKQKEKIKDDKYYNSFGTDTLNAFIRETIRRIIRLEKIMEKEKFE